MKLVRYGAKGAEKPGLIDKSGQLRDLSAHVRDLDGAAYSPESLKKLAAIEKWVADPPRTLSRRSTGVSTLSMATEPTTSSDMEWRPRGVKRRGK